MSHAPRTLKAVVKELPREAPLTREQVLALARVATEEVLVGGQALALWVSYYDVPVPSAMGGVISKDADFLTTGPAAKDRVTAFAEVLGGRAPSPASAR